jgi:hypothetical protein
VIAKIGRGSSFRGALNYVLHREHQPEIIGGNMGGTNARDLAREFGMSRQLRPEVAQPVETSLSANPTAGDPEKMRGPYTAGWRRWGSTWPATSTASSSTAIAGTPTATSSSPAFGWMTAGWSQPWREYNRNKVCRAVEKEMD